MPSRPSIRVQSLSQPFEPYTFRKRVMTKTADLISAGDNLKDWMWKGPENKEIADLIPLKNEFEIKEGI